MLNNIGGARTHTVFNLTNAWPSDIVSVLFRGIFRVECIDLIWHLYNNDWGECNIESNIFSLHQYGFGSGGMPFSVRLARIYIYTGNSMSSAEKRAFYGIFYSSIYKNTHKNKSQGRSAVRISDLSGVSHSESCRRTSVSPLLC